MLNVLKLKLKNNFEVGSRLARRKMRQKIFGALGVVVNRKPWVCPLIFKVFVTEVMEGLMSNDVCGEGGLNIHLMHYRAPVSVKLNSKR